MRKKSKQQTAYERKLALGLRLSAVYVKRLPHFILMRQPLGTGFLPETKTESGSTGITVTDNSEGVL